MRNKDEKEILSQQGIDTDRYFSLNLPRDLLQSGGSVTLNFNEDGQVEIVSRSGSGRSLAGEGRAQRSRHYSEDEFGEYALGNREEESRVFTNGYVRNTRLHRRFVMAQMFQMLAYQGPADMPRYQKMLPQNSGYVGYVRHFLTAGYPLRQLREEIRIHSILEEEDEISYQERNGFFPQWAVIRILEDYISMLENSIKKKTVYTGRYGKKYIYMGNGTWQVEDIPEKTGTLQAILNKVRKASSSREIYRAVKAFGYYWNHDMLYDEITEKPELWKDCYMASGSYYTLKNMIMYHNCKIPLNTSGGYRELSGEAAMNWLIRYKDYCSDNAQEKESVGGQHLMDLLRRVIEANRFDYSKAISHKY